MTSFLSQVIKNDFQFTSDLDIIVEMKTSLPKA